MKKIILTIIGLAMASPAWAAQTAVTQISGTQASVGALKTQVNTKLGTVESNRQDHETRVAAMESGLASQSAFTTTWGWTPGGSFDASGNYTLTGSWDFTGATVTGISGGSMTWPSTAGIPYWTSGTSWGGAYTLVTSVGATGADASIPSEQAVREAINALPSISAGTGITITEDGGGAGVDTIGVTANTYQAYDADLTTAAGASGAGNSKYFGTNSGGTAGFYDLPSGGSGSFTFDTFPEYEDSAHSSGIAVNGTTLAVYSSTAGKWLTVGLTDSLDAAPATYTLTIYGTGWNGTDLISVGGSTYTADGTKTGLSGTTSITVTPDTGRASSCSGTGITGSSSPYSADMSTNRTIACTFSDTATTDYTDNFNRTDANPLSTPWATPTGASSLKIASNVVTSNGAAGVAYYNASLSSDQYSSLAVPESWSGVGYGVKVRQASANQSGYLMWRYDSSSVQLRRFNTDGSSEAIGSCSTPSFTGGAVMRLEASGSSIVGKVGGTTVCTATDAVLNGGYSAMFIADINQGVDNWAGGNL